MDFSYFTDASIAQLLEEFYYSPLIIQIAIFFIFFSVLCILVTYTSILTKRYKGYRLEKKLERINPIIDDLILKNIIFNDELNKDAEEGEPANLIPLHDFQKIPFKSAFGKQALINRIISFRKSFKGTIAFYLRQLYIDLELDKQSFNKMKSVKWDKKVVALVELTAMDMSIADVNILPLTNSKNSELRAEARHAYIKLSKNEPFKFFDVVTEPLLMWDQIQLFKIITTTEDIAIPNFARWVTYSTNKSIVSFCLKLIVYYNQVDGIPAVIKLLDTKDHGLRANAINCLGKLKVDEVEDKLLEIYGNQTQNCQIEILKAIGRIRSGKSIDFLKYEFLHSSDFDLRKNAARSIISGGIKAQETIQLLLDTATKENLLILKHCMNPLIKF
ncbi:MAG: HEAT repeat domain-containing protein [Sphingobacteriales bacterium]|jgi:hypothetical protein|nr:MAG: HEAT repeat domain-containing protein [Sphingobacteriales bacterium]